MTYLSKGEQQIFNKQLDYVDFLIYVVLLKYILFAKYWVLSVKEGWHNFHKVKSVKKMFKH